MRRIKVNNLTITSKGMKESRASSTGGQNGEWRVASGIATGKALAMTYYTPNHPEKTNLRELRGKQDKKETENE
jgi:hypothetical protein